MTATKSPFSIVDSNIGELFSIESTVTNNFILRSVQNGPSSAKPLLWCFSVQKPENKNENVILCSGRDPFRPAIISLKPRGWQGVLAGPGLFFF